MSRLGLNPVVPGGVLQGGFEGVKGCCALGNHCPNDLGDGMLEASSKDVATAPARGHFGFFNRA